MNLHHGDCLDVLRTMPDNSVDSIVTDPPYGLSFMGKKWDYDVPSEDIWRECLRVLKPGGHLLAFAGTRTQHRMAVRIEDAGFEIRDMIAWVYGSGFPKSLDVGKAIDRMDAVDEKRAKQLRFTDWMRAACPIGSAKANELMGTAAEAGHYFTGGEQPHIATRPHFEALRPFFVCDVPTWIEALVDVRTEESKNFAEREVVGVQKNAMSGWNMDGGTKFADRAITAPATEAAKQWDGWGTALKPALEPITVARKPLGEKTVAANVLKWHTGGLNIDGCRVEANGDKLGGGRVSTDTEGWDRPWKHDADAVAACRERGEAAVAKAESQGRWPANLIHDGSDEVVGLFPVTTSGSRKAGEYGVAGSDEVYGKRGVAAMPALNGDSGSAARFFYCAKASKRDRDEGCEGMEERQTREYRTGNVHNGHGGRVPDKVSHNHHPTVKPTDLMRYLCRLVTPPGGVVLDPFMGSGSTGKAALLEGFQFIGIERDAEYLEIAKARIKQPDQPNQPELFQP